MKSVAMILVMSSLAVGTLAAATAYLVPLNLPPGELATRTLAADAGIAVARDGKTLPLVKKGETLTPQAVARLRAGGVAFVRVREFGFNAWPGRWAFLAAVAGLLAAAVLMRLTSRREIAAVATTGGAEGPGRALRAIQDTVERLRRQHALAARPEELAGILPVLTELQKTHMPAFVEARPILVARLGLGGYAGLMARYAAAERQINRAWSAAADGAGAEAATCLDRASAALAQAQALLASGAA